MENVRKGEIIGHSNSDFTSKSSKYCTILVAQFKMKPHTFIITVNTTLVIFKRSMLYPKYLSVQKPLSNVSFRLGYRCSIFIRFCVKMLHLFLLT